MSPLKEDLGSEHIDSLILTDDASVIGRDGFGSPDRRKPYYGAALRAKLALVHGLQPVLKTSRCRVLNIVDPFYAASPPLDPKPDHILNVPWRPAQPWTFGAATSLSSIAAFQYLSGQLPEAFVLSISTGLSRARMFDSLTASSGVFSYLLAVLLAPLIWAFGKSANECVSAVEKGIMLDYRNSEDPLDKEIKSGALLVSGRPVR